jgi:osmotically-inducible protein OsmY
MKRNRTASLMGGLTMAALLMQVVSGCNRTEPYEATTAAPDSANGTARPASDMALSTSVQAKYYGDDTLRADRIDVAVENGVVTLRGTVASDAAKQRAASLASSVEGVSNVQNELTVSTAPAATAETRAEPPAATATMGGGRDDSDPSWITTKIQAQYFMSPEIKPWNIDVTTMRGGVVTVAGLVESQEDKSEALRIARETEGVTRVEDQLRVKRNESGAPGEPVAASDAWVTSKIQAKYFLDGLVKLRNIDVDTRSSVVTLTGAVGTEPERRRAVSLARSTDGVREVIDKLRVDPAVRTGDRAETIPDVRPLPRPDPWITMKIQSQYLLDPAVKGHKIDVTTREGVVALTGNVESEALKRQAEQIAADTEGVTRVENRLTVQPGGA